MTRTHLLPGLPLLRASLQSAPVVHLKGYDYFVHPITDGIPRLEAALLREVTQALVERLPEAFDLVLTPEAMGIPLASGVSLQSDRPLSVARKRAYKLPGEIVVQQHTGYGGSPLHIHGVNAGDQIVILDDVLSTGGTVRALIQACRTAQADVLKVLVVVNKDVDLAALQQELNVPIEALVRLRVHQGRVHLED